MFLVTSSTAIVHFVIGTFIIPGLECFESCLNSGEPWVSYSHTLLLSRHFSDHSLLQLEPVGSGSAVTTVLGRKQGLRKSSYLSLVEAGGTTLLSSAGPQALMCREKDFSGSGGSSVALLPSPWIPNDKGIEKDFIALFSLIIIESISFGRCS